MKTLLIATAAIALLAAPVLADGREDDDKNRGAAATQAVAPVLNGTIDLGGDVELYDNAIEAKVDVDRIAAGAVNLDITDQIDSVTGKVNATATNTTRQINNGDIRATTLVGLNAGNRAADVTSAAIGNTLSIVNGISQ